MANTTEIAPDIYRISFKERLAFTVLSDGKQLVHRWGDDQMAVLPEVLRVAIGQEGIVPFDAEPFKCLHILRERLRATEADVNFVDLRDG